MLHPPGAPDRLRGRLVEVARWEWWSGQPGDPLTAVEDFLAAAGFRVGDLGSDAAPAPPTTAGPATGGLAGAALLLGATAGPAEARSVQAGAASPCPDVPDAAAVVFALARDRPAPPAPGEGVVGEWLPSWTAEDHAGAVSAVRRAIEAGDVYQVNIVGHRSARFDGSPEWVAEQLGRLPDTPYAGGLAGDGWAVVSASPELFLAASGGYATTRPIKGTEARSPGDDGGAARLLASAKDRAEHVMIVDLERNDLGRVARPGGVKVSRLYGVDPLAGLWHGVSEVTAHLQPGVGVGALLAATFPGGSVTGAPKLAALRELGRLEPVGRGPAMGALGWVDPAGNLTLGLTIRTVAQAAGRLHLWAGGGVTWGSDPGAEVAEADAKLAPLLAALTPEGVRFRPVGRRR